ncbi:MAG: SNF2 helicase associated domain-containing protein, partial [Planctomycetes bacterium]|nr:SNF2 helicase associated domain-containing protein [Planctomycetota bacterium]
MSLSHECSFSFDPGTRDRGEEYFHTGRVKIVDVGFDVVTAAVRGTAPRPYEVNICFEQLDSHEIIAECTCPRFQEGRLCKHIWATLRAIEDERMVETDAVLDDVVVLHAWEADDFDEDILSIDALRRLAGGRGAVPPGLSRPKTAQPSWHSQMSALFAHSGDSDPWDAVVERPCEVWYMLDVSSSMQRGGLVVDFFHRVPRKDGSWGKIKRLSFRRGDVSMVTEQEDRHLLQLLVGNDAQSDSGYTASFYASPYYQQETYCRAIVAPAMYELLLPRLCATGRFVWLLDSSMSPEDGRTIAWDDGEPWRLRLRIDPLPADQGWTLNGELARGEESRPLSEPVLMLAHGLVLFGESMARLDAEEHFPWVATLRRHPRIEIPRNDRQPFLQRLWAAPSLPQVELPDELTLEQAQGDPQGKLSIRSPDRVGRSNSLFADVKFLYREHEISVREKRTAIVEADEGRVVHRDREAERRLLAQLTEAGMRPPAQYDRPQADVHFPIRSLAEIVDRLTADGWLVESEGRLIRRAGGFHQNVTSGEDWFELGGQIDFDGVEVPLPRLLAALRSKQKYVRLDDGTQGILPDEWLQRFGSLVDLGDQQDDGLRFSSSQALLLDALLAAQEDVQVDDPFDQLRRRLRSFDGIQPGSEPRGFQGQLRPY